ncbi:ankyrin repeat domain-containing protein [Polynucleobacter sp. MG-Unter2-18]|uniref:ankyrin repeat domain-containing protein n=1 Tax=Polynucleobacter sp. MG-Unter2-18 TaxID=2081052 RepID=UPI001BFD6302|nr:ankyrin repeat domain-containing protein [Polynucleobacter sp. MG-Unter2-18]QWD93638.1 ankyrin repeat domain-containing protein [Polynucleobacter sp. MG-Unter2-18]
MRSSFKVNRLFHAYLLCFSGLISAQTADQIADFTKAAKFDDVSEVRSLIKAGVTPNTLDPKGTPMLILAVRDKSFKVTDLLLANPATDVNLTNKSGENALMLAAFDGELALVKNLVLQKKAAVNKLGWAPIHYAATNGHLEITQFLMANGAQINALSPSETTPLMMSIGSGNVQLIKYLLDNGADLRMRNHEGYTAIDVAQLFGKDDIRDGLMSRWIKLYNQPYPGGPKKTP